MAEEAKQVRVTTEEAFHAVGEALEKLSLRIDNHAEQLANHMEIIAAQGTLSDALIIDVKDLQSVVAVMRDMLLPKAVN
jgi:hypothetical protein